MLYNIGIILGGLMKTFTTTETRATSKPMEVYFPDAIMTYEDINLEALKHMTVPNLRNLAFKVGIQFPMSKTPEELVSEIQKTVETELNYYNSYFSND